MFDVARRPAHARLRHRPVRMRRVVAGARSLAVAARRCDVRRWRARRPRTRPARRSSAAVPASPRSRSTSGAPTPPRSPYNLSVNYVAQGSTFGRQQFTRRQLRLRRVGHPVHASWSCPASQSRRCSGQAARGSCFVYVPVSAGGLAFMYNLADGSGQPHHRPEAHAPDAACKIFTGAITKWNDPEIVATNPQFASFNRDIRPSRPRRRRRRELRLLRVLHRGRARRCGATSSTSSGPARTAATDAANSWPGQPTSVWPQAGVGRRTRSRCPYADGTANYVADPTGGAERDHATSPPVTRKVRNFPTASVQNAAGAFTQPDEENVTVALGYATPRGNGTFNSLQRPRPARVLPVDVLVRPRADDAASIPPRARRSGSSSATRSARARRSRRSFATRGLSSALVNIAIDAIVRRSPARRRSELFRSPVRRRRPRRRCSARAEVESVAARPAPVETPPARAAGRVSGSGSGSQRGGNRPRPYQGAKAGGGRGRERPRKPPRLPPPTTRPSRGIRGRRRPTRRRGRSSAGPRAKASSTVWLLIIGASRPSARARSGR